MISMRECVSFVILAGLLTNCFNPLLVKVLFISECAVFLIVTVYIPNNNGLFAFTKTGLYHFIKFLLEIFVKVFGCVE